MRVLFSVVAGLALWACHEQKPRPLTDCGDSCFDAGELDADVVDAGDDASDAADE